MSRLTINLKPVLASVMRLIFPCKQVTLMPAVKSVISAKVARVDFILTSDCLDY